jgi:hypothetical protein
MSFLVATSDAMEDVMSKFYLRREQMAARYGGIRVRTIERYVEAGKLPAPVYINGSRTPLWPVDVLEEFERVNMSPRRKPQPATQAVTARPVVDDDRTAA